MLAMKRKASELTAEEFRCAECNDIVTKDIEQCSEGHLFHQRCKASLISRKKKCPGNYHKCGVVLRKKDSRCYFMEKRAKIIEQCCKYKGCNKSFVVAEILEHEKICSWLQRRCFHLCDWKDVYTEHLTHLVEEHDVKSYQVEDNVFNIELSWDQFQIFKMAIFEIDGKSYLVRANSEGRLYSNTVKFYVFGMSAPQSSERYTLSCDFGDEVHMELTAKVASFSDSDYVCNSIGLLLDSEDVCRRQPSYLGSPVKFSVRISE